MWSLASELAESRISVLSVVLRIPFSPVFENADRKPERQKRKKKKKKTKKGEENGKKKREKGKEKTHNSVFRRCVTMCINLHKMYYINSDHLLQASVKEEQGNCSNSHNSKIPVPLKAWMLLLDETAANMSLQVHFRYFFEASSSCYSLLLISLPGKHGHASLPGVLWTPRCDCLLTPNLPPLFNVMNEDPCGKAKTNSESVNRW